MTEVQFNFVFFSAASLEVDLDRFGDEAYRQAMIEKAKELAFQTILDGQVGCEVGVLENIEYDEAKYNREMNEKVRLALFVDRQKQ